MTITKYKNHHILISLCLLVSLPVLLVGCTYTAPPKTEVISGTYLAGTGPYQRIFSVDPPADERSSAFYYADQHNDRYILGQLDPQEDGTYLLSCLDPNNADIIPDQELTYDGRGFSITIQDELFLFQKIDDIPSIIGDTTRYS